MPCDAGEDPVIAADVFRVVLWPRNIGTPTKVEVLVSGAASDVGAALSERSVRVRPDCASTVRRCLGSMVYAKDGMSVISHSFTFRE